VCVGAPVSIVLVQCDGCIEFSGAVRTESYLYSG
jgi:hypothetical protein